MLVFSAVMILVARTFREVIWGAAPGSAAGPSRLGPRACPGGVAVSLLVVDGVHKDFLGRVALSGVSFTVAEGECVGVIGPNGAGKTTLANIITGFLAADRGAVRFRGARIDGLPPHEISL